MRTRPASDLAFVALVGGFALSIVGTSCAIDIQVDNIKFLP